MVMFSCSRVRRVRAPDRGLNRRRIEIWVRQAWEGNGSRGEPYGLEAGEGILHQSLDNCSVWVPNTKTYYAGGNLSAMLPGD